MNALNDFITWALYASYILYRLYLWCPPVEHFANNLVCIWR